MNKNTMLHIRINQEIKEQAESLLGQMGLTTSDAINIFLHQVINSKGIPFEIKANTPNDLTISAIREVEEMINNPTDFKSYNNAKELFEDMN